jgi:hypothetical protein
MRRTMDTLAGRSATPTWWRRQTPCRRRYPLKIYKRCLRRATVKPGQILKETNQGG